MTLRARTSGFTIVELLIVIVVIAILAAISVVAYTGIQNRSKDSVIRNQTNQFAKALLSWSALTGRTAPGGGYSSSQGLGSDGNCVDGSHIGWVARGRYNCTIEEELAHHGLLPDNFVRNMPANSHMGASTGTYTLMLYRCSTAERTWVLQYHLYNPTTEDIANYDALITRCPNGSMAYNRTQYGMQGAMVLSLE